MFGNIFKGLFENAESFVPEARAFLRRFWAVFAVAAALLIGGFIFGTATHQVSSNAETWELTIASRLFLLRLIGAIVVYVVVVALGILGFNWFDNTKLGERLFHGDRMFTVIVFSGFLLTAALVLAGVVR